MSASGETGYDEKSMIEYTIIQWHVHLLTDLERAVVGAFLLRRKAKAYGTPGLEERWKGRMKWRQNPAIEPLMEIGYEAYCRQVADRVLREHGADLVLNRCPSCGRIVRTPKARQCMWCHHDWH